jgi:hypothetical protein
MDIKEILVLHHSHLDIGFTHSQPVLWEMQREFLDAALDLLDETVDWPESSQPRWTVEATAQLLKWIETASEEDTERFKRLAQNGRIGISGMLCHTTPLCNTEQLCRQLYPVKKFREQFSVAINTLNQHDVNGIPWSMVDIMIDTGIDLLIMAVNMHFGGITGERPSVFLWESPSGRTIKVMNGAHYTMFDQHLNTETDSLEEMTHGLQAYINHLEQKKYKHDFIYLTTANAPVCYDNSPPNLEVANLIRQWNEEGRKPLMKYVTPEMLLKRINEIDINDLAIQRGDWTDYWNFGCASNAATTKININTKPRIYSRDIISAYNGSENPVIKEVAQRAWWNLNLYDEHTWGSNNSMDHDNVFARVQAHLKDALAMNARELTEYLLIHELEQLADNPATSYHQQGILITNTTSSVRKAYIPIPDCWPLEGKRLRAARFTWEHRYDHLDGAPLFGPLEIEPYSWKMIPFEAIKPAPQKTKVKHGTKNPDDVPRKKKAFIENSYYRLEYHLQTGRITDLWDKKRKWQILDTTSAWTFFETVHEAPDPLVNNHRTALYDRDIEKEKFDVSLWQTDWKARRQGATRTLGCHTEVHPEGVTLVLEIEAPGANRIEQRITLLDDSPLIQLNARIQKKDVRTPEALYFAFPLNLPVGWKGYFNTAGIPLELDAEQLPGSSRDWVTVESFAKIDGGDKGATLYCPDAPMVQIGNFNYAKKSRQVTKRENPLLLAWPLNNYWETNFRASQPGYIELNYCFRSHGPFTVQAAYKEGRKVATPLEIHPAINCDTEISGKFFEVDGDDIEILHAKPAEDGNGMVFRVVNLSDKEISGRISVPSKKLKNAYLTTPLEEAQTELSIINNAAELLLPPRRITSLRLTF